MSETIREIVAIYRRMCPLASVTAISEVVVDGRFATWPASKTGKHHGHAGGLASHTLDVLQKCEAMLDGNPAADPFILATAAVWHDMGKMEEYAVTFEPDGTIAGVQTSDRGKLQKHISIGLQEWHEAMIGMRHAVTEAQRWAISHCIAAHHGRLEWGSPEVPMTIEAMLLHHADMQSVFEASGTNPEARG